MDAFGLLNQIEFVGLSIILTFKVTNEIANNIGALIRTPYNSRRWVVQEVNSARTADLRYPVTGIINMTCRKSL